MAKQVYGEDKLLVCLGYGTHPKVKNIYEKLNKFIGRKRFVCDISGTVVVEIPKRKVESVLKKFRSIKKEKRFWGVDYAWIDKDMSRFHCRYHPENCRKYGLPKGCEKKRIDEEVKAE